jgi:xylan 1,4-beta-xylosidase
MVNGKPTCANAALNKTLRSTWGFQGYVTSDSDSCACIYQPHAYAPSAEAAARDCLAGGTDIDSGATYLKNVAPALNDSTIASRATVDLALRNTYRLRMRLGLFEPHRDNDYRKFGLADVGAADSLAESLAASRQTMTLLKNDGATLPFKAGSAIAVVGQAVNDTVSFLTGNYNGPMNKSQVASIYGEVARLNAGGRTWSPPGIDGASVAAACAGADAIVLVVDNAHDGGTEGQDRYNITLSAAQISLATAVLALKIPTALVLVNGGAISIDDLADSAPAILEAWMPGTQGGTAIAETVLGLNNPGGKLPVTIYRSSYVDSADFLSMDIAEGQGRTYRYYKGATPMWRFGFGLSYTTFALKWTPPQPPAAAPPPRTLRSATDTTVYTVDVTNTGAVAGDEVVQAYFVPSPGIATRMGAPTPIKQLFDFQRVHLAAGASVTLKFVLNATSLAMADVDGHVSVHSDDRYRVVFSRGHGEQLEAPLAVALPERGGATRVETFERWW